MISCSRWNPKKRALVVCIGWSGGIGRKRGWCLCATEALWEDGMIDMIPPIHYCFFTSRR